MGRGPLGQENDLLVYRRCSPLESRASAKLLDETQKHVDIVDAKRKAERWPLGIPERVTIRGGHFLN